MKTMYTRMAVCAAALMVSSMASAVLLISYDGSKLGLFTDAGALIKNYATDLGNPQGVAVDSFGNAYVADLDNKRVRMYNSAGTYVRDVMDNTYSGGSSPTGLAMRADGQLIVMADIGATEAQFTTFNTAATNDWETYNNHGTFGAGYRGCYYAASQDRFYATTGDWVQYFAGSNLQTWEGNVCQLGSTAAGLAMDATGNVYAASAGGYIGKWDGGIILYPEFISTGLSFPLGVVVNGANLYVANSVGGNVQTYNLSGTLQSSFNISNPAYMAYTTIIPEPAALSLLGLGVVGLLRRKRN